MNNKKLSRLLEPNLKLYFLCMVLFCCATAVVSPLLALAEAAVIVALYAYFTKANQKRRQGILQYIDSLTGSVDTASKSTLINSPLPIMVFRPDTGEVIWSNENFLQLAGVREHLFEMKVEDAVPEFPVQWLLEGKQECPDRVRMNSRRFRVYGSLVRAKGRGGEQNLVATTYWVDTTDADELRERYVSTRPVLAVLMVDNYEDLMKACADTARSAVLAQIDEKLNIWASCADGLLLKTERDHYLFIFEERHYEHFAEDKFSVLDTIRDIKVGDVTPTLSIGIGKDADSMGELYRTPICLWRWPSAGAATRRWSGARWTLPSTAAAARPRKSGPRSSPGSWPMPSASWWRTPRSFISWATASRTWTPWAPQQAFAVWPASGASRPRWSSIWNTTPPGRCWTGSVACRSMPGSLRPPMRRF